MEKRRSFHIRDARDEELEMIRDVTLAAYEEYAAILPPPFWEGYRRQLLATFDQEGPVERIVAERDGTIIGSVLLYPPLAKAYGGTIASAGWPEVRLLAVAPVARGQGVGTALMDECERRARRAGAMMLGLHTMEMMQVAIGMYERRGFERVPDLDFCPAQDVLVKGYRRSLT